MLGKLQCSDAAIFVLSTTDIIIYIYIYIYIYITGIIAYIERYCYKYYQYDIVIPVVLDLSYRQ